LLNYVKFYVSDYKNHFKEKVAIGSIIKFTMVHHYKVLIVGKMKNKYLFILLLLVYALHTNAQNRQDISEIKIEVHILQTTSSSLAESFKIDTSFSKRIYKENFKLIPSKVNIYETPYSMKANYPNYRRLVTNTRVLYGAGLVALGILQTLPEDATAWNRSEIKNVPPLKRWAKNVKKGPVWDKDGFMFNYVLHPYGGAAYYMGARSLGFNVFYSFLYSAGISTLFWEYGIEAFMEIPSIQDLIVTPVAGVVLGEAFYILKRHIVSNGYRLFGSAVLGNVVAYIIDPVNEVIGIFAGNPNRKKTNTLRNSVASAPWINKTQNGKTFGLTVSLSF